MALILENDTTFLSNTEKIILEALDYVSKFGEIKDYLENIDYTLSNQRIYHHLSNLRKKGLIITNRDPDDSRNVHYKKTGVGIK